MANLESKDEPDRTKHRRPPTARNKVLVAAALVGACAVGAGATALAQRGRAVTYVALTPAPISAMKDWSPVAVKGQVDEIFGNKFVVQDGSGRALVETGPRGEGGGLVAKAETVIVQGRFENGSIHAVAIQHADGHADVVGPPGPPPPALQPAGPPAAPERG